MNMQEMQVKVADWVRQCFGPDALGEKETRNFRFLEEALELVQAGGCSREDAHKLVEYVYDRPVGEMGQEVGGVSTTLAALCASQGIDWGYQAGLELRRVNQPEVMEKIRIKQASKMHGGPLPGSYAPIDQPVWPITSVLKQGCMDAVGEYDPAFLRPNNDG